MCDEHYTILSLVLRKSCSKCLRKREKNISKIRRIDSKWVHPEL